MNQAIQDPIGNSEYFYSLVTPKAPKKNKPCLRCGTAFDSQHYGNRICGGCAPANRKVSVKMQQVAI